MTVDDRARITLPDLAYFLMTVAFIGALWPVFASGLDENAGYISTGEGYIYQLVLPLGVIVLLVTIIRAATGGGVR